jgi:OTU domain-containing protein 6
LTSSKGQTIDSFSVFDLSCITFEDIRHLAAEHMRAHADTYAPFLALPGPCAEYDAYCLRVESVAGAEWGGQTELSAIAARLRVPIWVYEVGIPVLKMGSEFGEDSSVSPLRVSYHRHFYALGEHYNSVQPLLPAVTDTVGP